MNSSKIEARDRDAALDALIRRKAKIIKRRAITQISLANKGQLRLTELAAMLKSIETQFKEWCDLWERSHDSDTALVRFELLASTLFPAIKEEIDEKRTRLRQSLVELDREMRTVGKLQHQLSAKNEEVERLRRNDAKSRESGCWCDEYGHPCKGCEVKQELTEARARIEELDIELDSCQNEISRLLEDK